MIHIPGKFELDTDPSAVEILLDTAIHTTCEPGNKLAERTA